MDTKERMEKENELQALLKQCSDEKGVLNEGYLFTPDGKRILEIARLELKMTWQELLPLLKKGRSTVIEACNRHGIVRKKGEHYDWSPERISVVEKYYRKSQALKSKKDSISLDKRSENSRKNLSLNLVINLSHPYWIKQGTFAKSTNRPQPVT